MSAFGLSTILTIACKQAPTPTPSPRDLTSARVPRPHAVGACLQAIFKPSAFGLAITTAIACKQAPTFKTRGRILSGDRTMAAGGAGMRV